MFINDDGIRLHIEIDRPEGRTGRVPMVILLHGYTGHMEEPHILGLRDSFVKEGFAVMRGELYGHGQSGGQFEDHTLYKWLTNTLTIIDNVRKLDWVGRLYLAGHSQGGLDVMLAGAMKQDQLAGIIPLSPAVTIPTDARSGLTLGVSYDPDHIPDVVQMTDEFRLNGNYFRVAQTVYPEEAVRTTHIPVLVVHGEADETIPIDPVREMAGLYEQGEFAAIPGDTHCYDYHLDQVCEAVCAWLKKQENETNG